MTRSWDLDLNFGMRTYADFKKSAVLDGYRRLKSGDQSWSTKATLDTSLMTKTSIFLKDKWPTLRMSSTFMVNPLSLFAMLFRMLSMSTLRGAKKWGGSLRSHPLYGESWYHLKHLLNRILEAFRGTSTAEWFLRPWPQSTAWFSWNANRA